MLLRLGLDRSDHQLNEEKNMSEAIPASAIRHTFHPSFFFWMTLIMAFFIFSGFGLTNLEPLAGGTAPPFPPIVHLQAQR
jgi:hypothetical protein